jgi:hypothetical protein
MWWHVYSSTVVIVGQYHTNPTKSVVLDKNRHYHYFIEYSVFSPWWIITEHCSFGVQKQSPTQSLYCLWLLVYLLEKTLEVNIFLSNPFFVIMKRKFKQFHQYQQNEQSPLISTELTEHKNTTLYMTLKIQVLAWTGTNMWLKVVGLGYGR